MIRSFRDRDSEAVLNDVAVRRLQAVERQASRKLLYLHRARTLEGDALKMELPLSLPTAAT